MGLSYDETMAVPISLLLDLIAVEQIKTEGFQWRRPRLSDDDELLKILSLK